MTPGFGSRAGEAQYGVMDPMTPMPADRGPAAQMRVSDADRDRVLTELSEHFQAGRLTNDEMQERTDQALAAKTVGDLSGLLSDLPAPYSAAPPPAAAPQPSMPARRMPAVAGVIAVLALLAVVLVASGFGHGHHTVGWGAVIPILIIVRIFAGGRGPAGRRRRF